MRDVLPDIERWRSEGKRVALGTVVSTWGSAPRRPGAKLAVSAARELSGSVSGGCVEGAVVGACEAALATGRPRLLRFGVAEETAWAVGLSCGGTLEVFVEALDERVYEALRDELRAERPAAVAMVVEGADAVLGRKLLVLADGETLGALGPELDARARTAALDALAAGESRRVTLPGTVAEGGSGADVEKGSGAEARRGTDKGSGPDAADSVSLFVEVHPPSPTLVIVGGVHIAVALTALAQTLGYRTVVVDPRRPFGDAQRFPHADRVVDAWPDEALQRIGLNSVTAVAVLTHDAKLDDPALQAALPSSAFYVGALGSRATQEKRRKRLLAAGLSEDQLARLHAPIGLDLGGRTPEEIALAVMAEVVAARNGRAPARASAPQST